MTRYLAMLAVFFMVVVSLIYYKMGGGELPVDFPRGMHRSEFDPEGLNGLWQGPGFLFFSDSTEMLIEARVSFEAVGDSSFETSTILTGHEIHYSDHGMLKLYDNKADWTITGMKGEELPFTGWLANDIVFVKYQSPTFEYKQQLLFRTPTRLYVAQELYKDSVRESWFEYTLEKK